MVKFDIGQTSLVVKFDHCSKSKLVKFETDQTWPLVKSAQFQYLAIFTKWSNSTLVKLDQWSNLTTGQIPKWSNSNLVKFDHWSNSQVLKSAQFRCWRFRRSRDVRVNAAALQRLREDVRVLIWTVGGSTRVTAAQLQNLLGCVLALLRCWWFQRRLRHYRPSEGEVRCSPSVGGVCYDVVAGFGIFQAFFLIVF